MNTRTITRLGFAALACAPLSVALGEGSELPDGSVVIASLPFLDTGDTTDNLDDYDAVCPWESTSADVFYAFTQGPDHNAISVYLCESEYDTKLFILDDQFNEIACDDDACVCKPTFGFQSFLICVPVAPGDTVHIAVDGWSGDAGLYEILVEACDAPPACIFSEEMIDACPTEAMSENEPCVEDAEDVVNGGCNGTATPLFTSVACDDIVCGQVYQSDTLRDTDWYELTHGTNAQVTMTGVGENALVFGRIEDSACTPGAPECTCIGGTIDPFATPALCEEGMVTAPHSAGASWWFVSTVSLGVVPCGGELPGNDYVVSWRCTPLPCCTLGDANEDGAVDFSDLVILLANWGPCDG